MAFHFAGPAGRTFTVSSPRCLISILPTVMVWNFSSRNQSGHSY